MSRFLNVFNNVSSKYDLIELRIEKKLNVNLSKLLEPPRPQIIYTLRDKTISESERIDLLKSAIDLNVDFIDLDFETLNPELIKIIQYAKNKGTKTILSYHNFKSTPSELQQIYDKLKIYSPNYIKIVTFAEDINDNLKIFKLLKKNRNEDIKLIAFCMGEKGEISRILAPKFGSAITYASLKPELQTAEGQIPIKQLLNVYNYNKINSETKIFGLVGNPVKQSRGIYTHNRAFKSSKLNAVYLNFLVDNFQKFFKEFKPFISGLSITKPFKEIAVKYLDDVSEEVKEIGAVNTVIKKNGKWYGLNTDAMALLSLLPQDISKKRVAVLGTGGAARSAIYAAQKLGAEVIVFGRDPVKTNRIAKYFNCEFDKIGNIHKHKFKVLINATSIGMMPDYTFSPVDAKLLKQDMLIVDFVYNPAMTRLLIFAKAKGCNTISGLTIFKKQANLQKSIFRKVLRDG